MLAKIGWCELRLNDAAAARRSFSKALEANAPHTDMALAGLAIAWARLGKPERATPLIEELRAEHADSQLLDTIAQGIRRSGTSAGVAALAEPHLP